MDGKIVRWVRRGKVSEGSWVGYVVGVGDVRRDNMRGEPHEERDERGV